MFMTGVLCTVCGAQVYSAQEIDDVATMENNWQVREHTCKCWRDSSSNLPYCLIQTLLLPQASVFYKCVIFFTERVLVNWSRVILGK